MSVLLPQYVVIAHRVWSGSIATVEERSIFVCWTPYLLTDLTDALKGKHLEPVKVSLTSDKKMLIVDQFSRRLPPTRIPVTGGTVDFDKRFGTGAKCGAFNDD